MRRARLVALVLVVLAVQLGYVVALRPFGVVPNMILALVVLVGLGGTATSALVVALIGGFLLDLASGADFGLRLGLLMLVALITGMVHRAGLNIMGPMVALVLVAVATIVSDAAVLMGMAGSVTHWPMGIIMAKMGLEIVLNLGITLLLGPLVRGSVPHETQLSGME